MVASLRARAEAVTQTIRTWNLCNFRQYIVNLSVVTVTTVSDCSGVLVLKKNISQTIMMVYRGYALMPVSHMNTPEHGF